MRPKPFVTTGATGTRREDFVPSQPKRVYNAQVYWEKYGITARVAMNCIDEFVREVGGLAGQVINNDATLYSAVTGDPGTVLTFPLNGARWHTEPRDLAVLVTENQRERLAATLYHFGAEARELGASLLLLDPGTYAWTLAGADAAAQARGEFVVSATARRIRFTLPPRTVARRMVCRQSAQP